MNLNDRQHVFIEAENFENTGGWVVDPQFVEQMGSPYLLAHGLGSPVENARTRIEFPAMGQYHVWVRTKNWAPGNWEAAGRFKLIVNRVELEHTLGTKPGWNWQYAGNVEINETSTSIGLRDLTGFEGRCGAIYFCSEYQEPPGQLEELDNWRKKMVGESDRPNKTDSFDVVIVGGGIAGCAAAIAAAEKGLNVALIHDLPILGGNTSSETRVHTEGIPWHSKRIISMINTKHWPNGSPLAKQDDRKRHENIEKYENIHLYLQWRAFTAITENNSIESVDTRHTATGETRRFNAPFFIDCTGDGWLGFWAGAEMMYGREPVSKYDESWPKYGELWSPNEGDNRGMGSSVLWRTIDTGEPGDFPQVPWSMEVVGNFEAIEGTWHWEFSHNDLHQVNDSEIIRDHMFKAIYGSFYNAKQQPEN